MVLVENVRLLSWNFSENQDFEKLNNLGSQSKSIALQV